MELNIEITREDYIDFNKFYFVKKGMKKRILIVIIAAIILPVIICIDHPFYLPEYLIYFLITLVLFGGLYIGLMFLYINRTGKIPTENGSILGLKKYIITEEGFMHEGEFHKGIHHWGGIISIEMSKKNIFIFTDSIAAYIIPRRYFESKEKEELFIEEIRNRIPEE